MRFRWKGKQSRWDVEHLLGIAWLKGRLCLGVPFLMIEFDLRPPERRSS